MSRPRITFRKLRMLATTWSLLTGIHCFSQDATFIHYSSDQGFTGAAFKTIVQDSLGFLWISSGSGLYKFDGYNFIQYKPDPHDSLSLPNEMVRRIWMDPYGKVWAAFPDCISYYDRDIDGFISYKVSLDNSLPESMWFENSETVWLGTSKKGLMRLDLRTREVSTYTNKHGGHLQSNSYNTVRAIEDEGQFLLLGTAGGLWKFDKKKKSFIRPVCDPADSSLLYSGMVTKIFPHQNHHWVWINQRLIKLNSGLSVVHVLDFTSIQEKFDITRSYENARVVGVEEDADGIFWIASMGLGLSRYDPVNKQLKNFRNEKGNEKSLPSDVLNHVMIDRYGNVWVTTVNKGIVRLRKQSLYFYNYLHEISTSKIIVLPSKNLNHIFVGSQGNGLWIASMDSQRLDSLSFKKFQPLESIKGYENIVTMFRGQNHLWIGSLAAGMLGMSFNQQTGLINPDPAKIYQHDPNNPNTLSSNFIAHYWEDEGENLWIGTFETGLNKIVLSAKYGTTGSVSRYTHDKNNSNSLVSDGIRDLLGGDNHSILVSTERGLDQYQEGHFVHLLTNLSCTRIFKTFDNVLMVGSKNGLYEGLKVGDRYTFTKVALGNDPFITSIQEDRLGRLWILSYDGLIFYDRKEKFSLVFKKDDGLPSSRAISAGGSAQTASGIMIFSNAEGLSLFDPLSLRINTSKPKPIITQLKINNEIIHSANRDKRPNNFTIPNSINSLRHLTLDHTQNILSLEFSAMDFTAPEKNQYMYMLEGLDPDWVQADWKNRTATYTNLEAGEYTFKVKASNRDGKWNGNETKLTIHILPPPWKTWWAYTLYGLTLLAILFVARRNIIQRERLASTLKLEHLELEKTQEIDRLRSTFFTNISHEFRTPLSLIQGPAQNMIEKLKKERQLKANEAISQLDLILTNSNRLLRLVNQVLDLSKLESGGLKKEISEEEIFGFLKMVAGHFTLLSVQKRISLNYHSPNQLVIARFDKDKLEKILSNLIFNALKFTPESGRILITARLHPNSQSDSHQLLIDVQDSGVGIPKDQIERIFERFFQVREGDNQNVGAGIGLALSKELAEFLGGSLSVVSATSVGSTFTLTLPVDVVEIRENVAVNSSMPLTLPSQEKFQEDNIKFNGPDTKPLLLIVEDHVDLRKFICLCLGEEYDYLEAGNGREGLQLAIEQLPSLILSDVMMPEMDGVEMCNKIKQDHRTNHIPVILLTAKAGEESKLHGLDKGADDYIIKPFNKDELVLKIRNQILAQKRIQEKIRIELLSGSTVINAVSADEKFIARVKEIIEIRMGDEKLGVESLAEEIGLSRVQLYRKVIALTGISVNDFIRKLRLQKGAQLLSQNWGTVAQIAYEVGFSNPSYFSKCFKDQFGVVPSNYYNQKV